MSNLLLNLRLTALNEVGVAKMKKDGKAVECIVIPIEKNNIVMSGNHAYLNLVAWENSKLKDGKSHLIKPSITKEQRESLSADELKNIPIIGDVKTMDGGSSTQSKPSVVYTYDDGEEDMPSAQSNDDNFLPF